MSEEIRVSVRLFAAARDVARCEAVECNLPAGGTVAELRSALVAAHPALAPLLGHSLVAINHRYANDATPLPADAEVALIPPVSGG